MYFYAYGDSFSSIKDTLRHTTFFILVFASNTVKIMHFDLYNPTLIGGCSEDPCPPNYFDAIAGS